MEALWDVGQFWKKLGGVWGPGDAIHFEYPGFRQDLASGILGSAPPDWLASAADLFEGSTIASVAEAVGVHTPVTYALSHPVETFQPYVDDFTQYLRSIGLLQ